MRENVRRRARELKSQVDGIFRGLHFTIGDGRFRNIAFAREVLRILITHIPIPIMDIQIATLCDFASDYNGKLVISGTFDTLAARAVPVVHPSCALALRFCFTQEDAGRHKLSINIINEDGEALDPKNMPIEPEFEVKLPQNVPFLTRNMVMNLQGLKFPDVGIYSIDIGCDGELLVRLPLRVVKVTQGPNGETKMG